MRSPNRPGRISLRIRISRRCARPAPLFSKSTPNALLRRRPPKLPWQPEPQPASDGACMVCGPDTLYIIEEIMSERMKGKVVIVIGAGSSGPGWGNGKAAAVLYAREGAKIFAVDFRLEAAQETAAIIHS